MLACLLKRAWDPFWPPFLDCSSSTGRALRSFSSLLSILLHGFNEEEYAHQPTEEEDGNAVVAQGNELAKGEWAKAEGVEGMQVEEENLPEE